MYRLLENHCDLDLHSTTQRTIWDFQCLGITELEVIGKFNYIQPFRKLQSEVFQGMYELIYIERGEQEYSINNRDYLLSGGDLVITRPGERRSMGSRYEKRGCAYWLIGNLVFDSFLGGTQEYGESIINFILSHTKNRIIKVNISFVELLKRVFHYLPVAYSRLKAGDPMSEIHVHHTRCLLAELFFSLYVIVAKRPYAKEADFYRVEKVQRYIEENITELIDLEYISYQIVKLSLPHLRNLFKDHVGFPLRDYINSRKIAYSKTLLSSGKSVTTTAMDMSFSSSQYFATVFRKYTGISPSDYLQELPEKQG